MSFCLKTHLSFCTKTIAYLYITKTSFTQKGSILINWCTTGSDGLFPTFYGQTIGMEQNYQNIYALKINS